MTHVRPFFRQYTGRLCQWPYAVGLQRDRGFGQSDLFHLGFNLRRERDNVHAAAGIVATKGTSKTDRIAGASGDTELAAEFNAPSVMARLEAGLGMTGSGSLFTPFAAHQASAVFVPACGEMAVSGDPMLALDYAAKTLRTARTELGLR